MTNDLFLLWLAAFPLMGSPGPATLSLAGVGKAYGFRRGLPYLAGIVFGTVGVLLLVASGVTAIILAQPALVRILTTLAAIYILFLAWKIASAPVGFKDDSARGVPRLLPGLVLAIANPKAFAAIGAVYAGQNLFDDNIVADAFGKLVALSVVIVISSTAWLAFGSLFSRLLSHRHLGRAANVSFALMLAASVGFALLNL